MLAVDYGAVKASMAAGNSRIWVVARGGADNVAIGGVAFEFTYAEASLPTAGAILVF